MGDSGLVWFDAALAAPTCAAFIATVPPSDLTETGVAAAAAPAVLMTQTVPGGCGAKLPVLCM